MKNIHVFAAELPSYNSIGELLSNAEGLVFNPLTENQWSKLGLDPKFTLTQLSNGYKVNFKYSSKELPAQQILEELNLLLEDYDYEPSKKEIGELTESITSEFCARVICKTVNFSAYYHEERKTLIFDCKEDLSRMGLSLLLKALGSIETTTLHCSGISNTLTTNMLDCLRSDSREVIFNGFDAGDLLVMQNKEKDVARFKGEYPLDNIQELIESGYEIKQINLSKDDVSFTLTEKFKIKGVKTNFEIEEGDFADNEEFEIHKQSLELEIITSHCDALRDLFDKQNEE